MRSVGIGFGHAMHFYNETDYSASYEENLKCTFKTYEDETLELEIGLDAKLLWLKSIGFEGLAFSSKKSEFIKLCLYRKLKVGQKHVDLDFNPFYTVKELAERIVLNIPNVDFCSFEFKSEADVWSVCHITFHTLDGKSDIVDRINIFSENPDKEHDLITKLTDGEKLIFTVETITHNFKTQTDQDTTQTYPIIKENKLKDVMVEKMKGVFGRKSDDPIQVKKDDPNQVKNTLQTLPNIEENKLKDVLVEQMTLILKDHLGRNNDDPFQIKLLDQFFYKKKESQSGSGDGPFEKNMRIIKDYLLLMRLGKP